MKYSLLFGAVLLAGYAYAADSSNYNLHVLFHNSQSNGKELSDDQCKQALNNISLDFNGVDVKILDAKGATFSDLKRAYVYKYSSSDLIVLWKGKVSYHDTKNTYNDNAFFSVSKSLKTNIGNGIFYSEHCKSAVSVVHTPTRHIIDPKLNTVADPKAHH